MRSHRAPPGPVAKAGTGARVTALLIAALALGAAIANWRPLNQSADDRERPYVRTGTIGQQVSARVFDATLLSARGAGKVGYQGQAHDTGGVWMIVRIRLTATDEATTLGYAAVRDHRDRVYLATQRVSQQMLGGRTLQPGIPVEADLLFEVPRDAATDLTLLLAEPSIDHRMDTMAEIALPHYDTATVDGWASATEPAILTSPKAGS
ncbi:hypothetical protein WEI85_34280 [Actinomycetes bacterium KLBMP 9797]